MIRLLLCTLAASCLATDPAWGQAKGMSKTGQPSLPRYGHTQVWTGDSLIVWGGATGEGKRLRVLVSGATYFAAQDLWSPLASAGGPAARYGHSAVWTGTEMIVWGGRLAGGVDTDTGARYNPASGQWSPISSLAAPSPRAGHTAVWTGTEMIVWGGEYMGDGAAYNPVSDSWREISAENAPRTRIGHAAVWTGRFMAIWGGDEGDDSDRHGSGGLYDPFADRWIPIAEANAPWGGEGHQAIEGDRGAELLWTGNKLIAFPINGGGRPFRWWHRGGIYDIESGSWTRIERDGAPSIRPYGAVWTPRGLFAVGSKENTMRLLSYDFGRQRWRTVSTGRTGSLQGRVISWAPEVSQILLSGGRWADGEDEYSGGPAGQRGFRISLGRRTR